MNKLKHYSDEELKKEFIKYFGEEKWNQDEALSKLWPVELVICSHLGIDPVPVIAENMVEDSRYYVKDNYIAISDTLIFNEIEAVKCLIHELRHLYQNVCVARNDIVQPNVKLWKKEFLMDINSFPPDKQICLSIEIDAYAYQKYMLKLLYKIEWHYPDLVYDSVIDLYIEKYLN